MPHISITHKNIYWHYCSWMLMQWLAFGLNIDKTKRFTIIRVVILAQNGFTVMFVFIYFLFGLNLICSSSVPFSSLILCPLRVYCVQQCTMWPYSFDTPISLYTCIHSYYCHTMVTLTWLYPFAIVTHKFQIK